VTLIRRFGDEATLFGATLARQTEALRAAAPRFTGDVEQDLRSLGGSDPLAELAELLRPILLKRMLAEAQPALSWSDELPAHVERCLNGRTAEHPRG